MIKSNNLIKTTEFWRKLNFLTVELIWWKNVKNLFLFFIKLSESINCENNTRIISNKVGIVCYKLVKWNKRISSSTDTMTEQSLLKKLEFNPNESLIFDLNYTTINISQNSTQPSNEFEEDKTLRNVLTITCYSVIVLVSLCGNLLVCKVAFGKRKMHTTTNMLIASLACSDLVMTVFNIPFNVARLLLLDWPFGSVLCFLVPFIQTSCVYVSTFTMTVIALHRWRTVSKSHNMHHISCVRLIYVIIFIWLLAMTLSLPHSMFNHIKQVNLYGKTFNRCRATYPGNIAELRLYLTLEVFITQYLTPLLITLVCISLKECFWK